MRCAKRLFAWLLPLVAIVAFIPNVGQAGIAISGDISPSDSGAWNADTVAYVGDTAAGMVTVDSDSDLVSNDGYIGYASGGTGTVTVEGTGSTWTAAPRWEETPWGGYWAGGNIYVGSNGYGTLNITNGGTVYTDVSVYIGVQSDSVGAVTVAGADSMLRSVHSEGGWDQWQPIYVGQSGTGELNIQNGGIVNAGEGYIGSESGSNGTVTVDNATWNNEGSLYVGYAGTGTLNIYNGGVVTVTETTHAPYDSGWGGDPAGMINFGSDGGTLTTKMLQLSPTHLTGTGTIEARGLISDVHVTFDSGSIGTAALNESGQDITLYLDMGNSSDPCDLGIGSEATGSLKIENGTVYAKNSYLGHGSGSTGTAIVTGSNSQWVSAGSFFSGNLSVGYQGSGTLLIENGGSVINQKGSIGVQAAGTVTVEGEGSTWTNHADLQVGSDNASGTLNIYNGSTVSVAGKTATLSGDNTAGTINFGADGGTLTTRGLWALPSQLTGTGTINSHGLVSDADITFDSGPSTTLTLDGSGQDIDLIIDMSNSENTGDLGVGYLGNGTLRICNGTTLNQGPDSKVYIGYLSGSHGTATVTEASQWNLAGQLAVGYGGDAVLNVLDGSSVSSVGESRIGESTGSGGEINVDGNSTWTNDGDIYVAGSGDGELEITGGGTVTSTGRCYIGHGVGVVGTTIVDGADSRLVTESDMCIGFNNFGQLKINNGGIVSVDGATYIAYWPDAYGSHIEFGSGSGTLTTKSLHATPTALLGTGKIITNGLVSDGNLRFDGDDPSHGLDQTFTINGNVSVDLNMGDSSDVGDLGAGYDGNGTLMICNGISVHSANGYLGYKKFAAGTATVTGSDSMWTVGTIYVGTDPQGKGTINIVNDGTIRANSIRCGGDGWSGANYSYNSGTMTVNFDGGTLQANNTNSSYWLDADPSPGGKANIFIQENGATFDTLDYNMTISGALQHGGGTATDGGITKVGGGTLSLDGANTYTGVATVEAGVLKLIGIDTSTPSAWDAVLTLGGADVPSGKLVFDYTGSYGDPGTSPATTVQGLLAASFTGGTAAWTTGQFLCSNADGSHGLGWIDNETDMVTVMYTLYGDSNLDGSVNGSDLNAVLSNYNLSGEWEHGDFNYDGSVNGTDLNTVLSNYNQSLLASTAAVPEPSTLLLLILGLAGLLAYVMKKRK